MLTKHSRVLRNYIKSFAILAMVVGLTVGLLLLFFSVGSMRKTEKENIQARLQLAANDLEQQIIKIEEIANKTKYTKVYQPIYFTKNSYYHLELIDHLALVDGYLPLLNSYYLVYTDLDSVFSQRYHWSINQFVSIELGENNDLGSQICGLQNPAFLKLSDNRFVFTYPLHIGSVKDLKGNACFLVIMRLVDLEQRICSVGGFQSLPQLDIAFNSQSILQDDQGASLNSSRISVDSPKDIFTLSVADQSELYSGHIIAFQYTAFLLLVLTLFVFVCLAVALGFQRYKPIRQLHASFVADKASSNDELKDLEMLISQSLDERVSTQSKITEQIEKLKTQEDWLLEQQILLLINGDFSAQTITHLKELGIHLHHRYFCVVYVHHDQEDTTEWCRHIRELSDDEISFCPAKISNLSGHVILANFEEADQEPELLFMIQDICESVDMKADIHSSTVSQNLSDIPRLALEAISVPEDRDKQFETQEETDAQIEQATITRLMGALDARQEARAISLADEMLDLCETKYTSLLFRYHYVSGLWKDLTKYALKAGISDINEEAFVNITDELPNVRAQIHTLIHAIISTLQQNDDSEVGLQSQQEIPAYIEAHALENSISQASVAEAFGISLRQVSRVLKNCNNLPFREYVIQLRIDAAKKMLRTEGITVAETAERTGFNNVSHFVRTFRENVGITPGEYRKGLTGLQNN